MSSIREARALLDTAQTWADAGHAVALLSLVAVKGSAYRRPGAKMVMAANGRMQGSLSGGCLEGDLFLHAEQAMEDKRASVHRYDLTEDEMWGLGIGCKGQVDVWVEPLDLSSPFWREFRKALESDQPVVWGGQVPEGLRYFATSSADWKLSGTGSVPRRPHELEALSQTGFVEDYWWDIMRPPVRVIVAGAGHDARPVARLAQQAGFDVTILDPRPHINNADHFPDAELWVRNAAQVDPQEVRGSFWVIMNHHQQRDEEALTLAASSHPAFVGVLGPKTRTAEMIAKTGIDPEGLPIHAPVGLDLGAESPDEVAVSIVSELMARRSGTHGGALHGHDRIHR